MTSIAYTLIGGPTFLIEIGGARILVDPTFDEPQTYTGPGVGRADAFIKTRGPALTVDEILPIDVVLVTHDQHIDHLDHAGRAMLAHVPRIFTTHEGAERLGGVAIGLGEFEVAEVVTPTSELMLMGVRAQHGPEPLWRGAGACNGFVIRGDTVPSVYISGDNYSIEVAEEIASRVAPVDVVILFGGGARFDEIADGTLITMPNEDSIRVARMLDAQFIIPAHTEGWGHFKEAPGAMVAAFEKAGLAERLVRALPGQLVILDVAPRAQVPRA